MVGASTSSGDNGAGDFPGPKSRKGDFGKGNFGPGNNLRTRLRLLATTPVSNYNILQEVEDMLKLAGEASTGAVIVAEGDVAVEAATAVGGVIVGLCSSSVIIAILIVLAVLLFLEAILYNFAGLLPSFFGRKIQAWIHVHFAWLNNAETFLIEKFMSLMQQIGKEILDLIKIVLEMEGILPEGTRTTVVRYADKHAEVQIQHLQQQVNYLLQHVGSVEYITHNKRVVVGVPQNVWDDIHHLEQQVHTMRQDITSLQNQVDRALHDAQSANNRIGDVTATIHEVRAISVGWSDIQQTVSQLQTRVTMIQNSTSERLDNLGRVQTQMQPLAILQGGGVRGLRVLRQLEDTPCMCPKVPGIPNEFGAALAMYEFVTNG